MSQKKIGLLLRVTTDFFFKVSIQNLISKLLTFIRKKWGTACSDILPRSKIRGKNVKKSNSKKLIFVKNFVKWPWTLLSRCLTIWRKKFTKRMFLDWEVFINFGICNTNHLYINSSQKIEIKSKIQIQSYIFRDILYIT